MTADRLHILFLASWYPSLAHRTLGNFIQRHAEAVALMHDVHVLYITPLQTVPQTEIQEETVSGVHTTIVYYKKGWFHWISRMRAFLKGIRHLQENGWFHFDLVHLNVIWPQGWQALYLKWKYGVPYIITEHWTGYDQSERAFPGKKVAKLSIRVAEKAAVICPVTDNLGAAMQAFGLNGKYITVPNVVDTGLFHIAVKPDGIIRFIHVSSLNEAQKNISGILNAWKKASALNTNIHLHIGGDGPIDTVKADARQLGIPASSISFFGEQPWEKIAALMMASHCLILFSNYENLPCVITEAFASGLPVISSRVGGISEHVGKENGILIEKRDEDALVSAILSVADDPHRFKPEALRQYAVDHFSREAIARAFSTVYFEALKSNH